MYTNHINTKVYGKSNSEEKTTDTSKNFLNIEVSKLEDIDVEVKN
jgi:hypothetical protein